jgi:acetyl esterase
MKSAVFAALLACSALMPAGEATAQTAPAEPTLKDRVDQAISTVTGSPMAEQDIGMKHVTDALAKLEPKPIETLSPEEARKQPTIADAVRELLKQQNKVVAPAAGVATRDMTYPAGADTQPIRIYTPEGASGPLPVVVYYHGGGFVIADIDVYDATPRAIARGLQAIVVSAEYRHAPEAKFPAQHEDAVAAYKWVLANAASFGGDPAKVALMGESAGGNLATNVAIAARDQNLKKPAYVVAIYPVAGTSMETQSYKDNASAKPLNAEMMAWFVKHTIGSDADKEDPRLDLIGKADLRQLPPFTIVTAEIDPLRDDGKMLTDKLQDAGVSVKHRDYEGMTHEFFGLGNVVAKAKGAQDAAIADLRAAFAGTQAGTTN